jgi:hypothetical protein
MTPISYLDIHFTITVAGQAPDLPFLGPTVRGLLGYGLRAHCCDHAAEATGRCAMGDACAYAYLFEGPLQRAMDAERLVLDALPQPFIPLVDAPHAKRASGSTVRFGVRLLGNAIDLAPTVAAAIRCREAHGFGTRSHAFRLEQVELAGTPVWQRARDCFADQLEEAIRARVPFARSVPKPVTVPAGRSTVRWTFRTPVAVAPWPKRTEDWPTSLIDGMSRRLWLLERAYCLHSAHRAIPRAIDPSAFALRRCELHRFDFARRSTRHGSVVRLGGSVGVLEIEGPWSALAPLLANAAVCGVGQSTSFGFGQVDLEVLGPTAPATQRATGASTARRGAARSPRSSTPRWIRLRGERITRSSPPPGGRET